MRLLVGIVVIDRSCDSGNETESENDAAAVVHRVSQRLTSSTYELLVHILPLIRTFFERFAFRLRLDESTPDEKDRFAIGVVAEASRANIIVMVLKR